jgi:hypothetical protein
MKSRLFQKFTATLLLTIGTALALPQPSPAQSDGQFKYFCGMSDGLPTTMASDPEDPTTPPTPLIRWKYDGFGSRWNPKARCEEVSERFQSFQKDGMLNFLTTGQMRGYNVICVARTEGGDCEGLLLTLPPRKNPGEALLELTNQASVHENNGPSKQINGRWYINIDRLILRNRPR